MAHTLQTRIIASITELKRDPMGTVASGEGEPVAILSRNDPAFYCVPADTFEAMLERLEDLELNAMAEQRAQDGSQPIKVSLDEL
ncbi:antitoxin StbD [Sulfurivirga caldicuralii]|uniref:Antitoxin StbD n=1 Tax=Sulfurivirga caldicuralii TaxID=364032 RepID=A0A1N6H7A6_9GAMM|nr:type II toxin-antitoxin system Phd/YefM family antitoxin [Sulfurivirga caldicuralii]SIO15633.1 antitoxin StbD [Sulfurivirga caldicuralii]